MASQLRACDFTICMLVTEPLGESLDFVFSNLNFRPR